MLFRHKWESNKLALLRRDLGLCTVDSLDIFYKLLGIATAVYGKGKGYLRGKVFFYTQNRIASREKKTSSEINNRDPIFKDDGVKEFLQRLEVCLFFLPLSSHFLVELRQDDTLEFLSAFFQTFSPLSWNSLQTFHSIMTSIISKRHEIFSQFIRIILKMTRSCARPRATSRVETTLNEHTN